MRADFEAALRLNPADWRLRLVYADWLDEQGHTEEGRAQRDLAAERGTQAPRRLRLKDEGRTTGNSSVYRKRLKFWIDYREDDSFLHRPRHVSWKRNRRTRWK